MQVKTKHYPLGVDLIKYGGLVAIIFITGILLAASYLRQYPALLSMALLSFVFGLQHAFDIDHITAIDNITRKMINEGRNTHGVGFCFSLGHSLVVNLMALVTIFFVTWSKKMLPAFQSIGGIIGTTFAGAMLILLAIINLFILVGIWSEFKHLDQPNTDAGFKKGRIYHLFERSLHLINHNWQVIGIGFLFGLGFDTATQIAVLATSAVTASQGVPWYAVLSFPLLFTAGMCLLDTGDGIFMSTAYSWVFASPYRKVYYNLVLTGLSVAAALFSGIVNLLLAAKLIFGVDNAMMSWVEGLNFTYLGLILVGLFVVTWSVALICWHYLGLNKKDQALKSIK
ncbi:HoxN/HupN/NixA family nickel/cobalt transporter [Lactiplantibacillus daowaiensis]|uniref:Nickel/cobalt efflux system n=1 Tax=Lactiplantibacillus daowaiensis TaxID=2559918 RepID=A0ABW1RW17_9LACO|nr:HoxN/HupN/NixA family nickel/cobalt transporter [Lactiplantibacillus daowaiensis]